MGEITKEEMRERLGNIDQIRDIIFGPQLREYDRRIDKLESNLSLLEQEMRDRIEQVKTTCLTELRSAVDSLEKKNKSISLGFQNDNAELRQTLDRVNKKLSTSIESLDNTVDRQTTALHNSLSETRDTLQEDIHNLRAKIFEELERRFSMILNANVSRDDMAEILFELGLRIRGTEFAPELKEAAGANIPDDKPLLEASQTSVE
jgi:DNA anti-recombination protein RmuC